MKYHYVYDGKFPKSMFKRRYIYTIFQMLIAFTLLILIVGCLPNYIEKYDSDDPLIEKVGLYDYCKWLIDIRNDYPDYVGCIEVEVDTKNQICKCTKTGEK